MVRQLTEGGLSADDVALAQLGVERPQEYVYNRQVLERLGVPTGAIRVLTGRNNNTAEEVRTIARALSEIGPNAHEAARRFLVAMIDADGRDDVQKLITRADRARRPRS